MRPGSRRLPPALLSLLAVALPAGGGARADEAVTVAVAYFDNTAGAPELDVLRKGIADMLISDLAQLEGVRLVEREKLEALLREIKLDRGPFVDPKTAQRMGRGLGAQLLVSGSFLSLSPSLRIDARVVSVETGEVMAAASAEGAMGEFFQVQAALALKLAEALGGRLTVLAKARVLKPRTRSLEAMTAYARGLDAEDRGDARAAREAFGKALQLDPEFARAAERLAALEKRVAELEQRTTALEGAGGYVLRPQTPADWFGNAAIAAQKGDAKRQLDSFLGGWKAAQQPGVPLPLALFLRTVAGFSYGAAGEAEAAQVLATLERGAGDASLPADRRALCALLAGGEGGRATLESLASADGFAAWALGLLGDGALRAEQNAAAVAGSGRAAPGATQKRLLLAAQVPLLPFLEACGASKYSVAGCLLPTPLLPPHRAVLLWLSLARRHAAGMRAFADGRGATSFDEAGTATLRRHLGASIDLLDFALARAAEHPLGAAALGPPPDEKTARAWADDRIRAAAARPTGTTESGAARPGSLFLPASCRGLGGPAWSRVRQVEDLAEAELSDDVERPVLWTPRRLCAAVDASLRIEAARRLLDSGAWRDLGEEGPRAEPLSWLVLDALDLQTRPSRLALDAVAPPPRSSIGCAEVMAGLSERAAARAGSPSLERLALFSSMNDRSCGLYPSRQAAEALRECREDRAPSCLQLASLHAKALGVARPEHRERGFWGEAGRVLRERCQRDRAFCSELGQAWLEAGESHLAADPRRAAGRAVLEGACTAGSMEACVLLANRHTEGRSLAPSAEAALERLHGGLEAARRECEAGRPCLLDLDVAKRCRGGDYPACEVLLWLRSISMSVRGEVSEVRAIAARVRRDLEADCRRGDTGACALAADPIVPLAVPLGWQRPLAITVLDRIEGELMADVMRRCRAGDPRDCRIESDYHVIRAARLADRAGDRDAEAAARSAAEERYRAALAGWSGRCRDPESADCPRWRALETLCRAGGAESDEACGLLVDELGRDFAFRRAATSCREADARRCRVDALTFSLREESRGIVRGLAEGCTSGGGGRGPDSLRCRMSRHLQPSSLPHLPEVARQVARDACQALRPRCPAPPAGSPPATGRPAWCGGSALKDLCPP